MKHTKMMGGQDTTPHSQLYKRFKKSELNIVSTLQSCSDPTEGSRSATKAEEKYRRKFQIDFEERTKGLETGQILQIEPNCIEIEKIDISPFRLGNDDIEGDRMIPLRAAAESSQKNDRVDGQDS